MDVPVRTEGDSGSVFRPEAKKSPSVVVQGWSLLFGTGTLTLDIIRIKIFLRRLLQSFPVSLPPFVQLFVPDGNGVRLY